MTKVHYHAGGLLVFLVLMAGATHAVRAQTLERSVAELKEGTVRTVYVDRPKVGAKGYVVGAWRKGEVRVEVWSFPQNEKGYEVFLFEIDVDAYMSKMFIDGDAQKGIVPNPPPFQEVAGLITKWHSLGDIKVDTKGAGTLNYRKSDNLYEQGLNMIFIFGKVTEGQHGGPEDFSLLMVECNGPIPGTKGSEGMESALTVWSKEWAGRR
ncbi:hypothetical protein MYX82_11215 [Acidobacteria bacterium AH-259-D05]|nr:hypothetical protein [Acidobacteria bacterium AH-259-D05]